MKKQFISIAILILSLMLLVSAGYNRVMHFYIIGIKSLLQNNYNFMDKQEMKVHNTIRDFHYEEYSFTAKAEKSFINKYKQKCFHKIKIDIKLFERDEHCDSTFVDLLSKLNAGKRVIWGDTTNGLKSTPKIIFKGNHHIIECKILCEHENNNWHKFKNELIDKFKEKNCKIIEIGCGETPKFTIY